MDLLAFGAIAETAVEAVLDDDLDPVALGVSGPWGSGKSTVLKLLKRELEARLTHEDQQLLVVETDPWRYDPTVGAKGTLIGEVLGALNAELLRTDGLSGDVEGKLRRLAKRVNWVKAVKLAAKTSITLQLPSIDSLSDLISENDLEAEGVKSLDEFKADFEDLLNDPALSHVVRVVVLVDDLDRCLPETVVETLETMRLFLSVPKMSFVIAADEDRVADALRNRFPNTPESSDGEDPAKLYLHKIVQTTLRLPSLSRFDTEAFLLLLLLQKRSVQTLNEEQFTQILDSCTELRTKAEKLDTVAVPTGIDLSRELQFAARLTPILYEKLHGSPRRVKRFLNDLNVRVSIASRRGIELELDVVAKLMILELLLQGDFRTALNWLATGELRSKLAELESQAGRPSAGSMAVEAAIAELEPVVVESSEEKRRQKAGSKPAAIVVAEPEKSDQFSEDLLRWAKLPPALSEVDLSPYLHLAASFTATPLIDSGLPERLRDLGANLLSSSRTAQKSVTDEDLLALSESDATALIQHLGRMARDRPADLISGVGGILRVARLSKLEERAKRALLSVPAKDVKAPVVLLFGHEDAKTYGDVLQHWSDGSTEDSVKTAVGAQRNQRVKS
ncbi:MAG: P-loop NTPase fold protein [Acidimicrobiales bacterium]